MFWAILVVAVVALLLLPSKRITVGPTGYPVIGSVLALINEPLAQMGHWFKQYGDTFEIKIFGNAVIVTKDPQLMNLTFTSPDMGRTNSFQDALKDIMPFALFTLPSGDVWKRHRKMLSPAFGPPQLRLFQKIMTQLSEDLVEKIKEKQDQPINISSATNAVALDAIASVEGLGDFKSVAALLQVVNMTAFQRFQIPSMFWPLFTQGYKSKKIQEILDMFHTQLEPALTQEKSDEGTIMQSLLGQDLSKEELYSEVFGLFIAGQDTTSAAVVFLIKNLCENPEIQEQLAQKVQTMTPDEIMADTFVDQVVHESMRKNPSVPMIIKSSLNEVKYNAMTIPGRTTMYLSVIELHNNPEIYPNPDKFDPSRPFEPKAYFPFGGGPQMCIGYKMALMEIKLVVCYLLKHFRLEMLNRENTIVHGIISKLQDPLMLKCHPRS
ncbi:cytochrome P450 [Gorgonomyces haynaldii]|nr:cytochrome P450 [Gorgonomyces haynaldii]